MNLSRKQRLFMRLLPRLLDKLHEIGLETSGGDLFRDPRVHGEYGKKKGYGRKYSMHKLKLAIDLNLKRNGVYLSKTEDHRELGEWWEQQHTLCRWGGRRANDGNHYSLTHDGRW